MVNSTMPLGRTHRKVQIDIGINVDRGHHRTGANTWWSKVDFVEDDRVDGHWVGVLPRRNFE